MVICIAFTTLQARCGVAVWGAKWRRLPLSSITPRPSPRSYIWPAPLPHLQTSYLLLFTVAFSCGKKSAGFKNTYFPDQGRWSESWVVPGRGGDGWSASSCGRRYPLKRPLTRDP